MFENINVGDKVALFEGVSEYPERLKTVTKISRVSIFTREFGGKDARWLRKDGSLHGKSIGHHDHYEPLSRISDAPKDIRMVKTIINRKRLRDRIEAATSSMIYEHMEWTDKTRRKFVKQIENLVRDIEAFEDAQISGVKKTKAKIAKKKTAKVCH